MRRIIRPKPGLGALAAVASLALPAAAQAAPDLVPNIISIAPQPSAPNSTIGVKTTIANASNETVSLNVRRPNGTTVHIIRWYFSERGGSERFVLAQSMLGKLAPRRKLVLNANIRIPSSARPGTHQICAVVDPTNAIRERNEGNNRVCKPVRVSGRPGRIAKVPGLKPGLKPGLRPGLRPIKPGLLQKQCINPAIVELQVGIIRKDPRNRFQGTIQLKAVLKNIGNADYVTNPNQQSVQIHQGRRLLKNERFGNLRKGETKIIAVQLPWNAAGEFQENMTARIVYDPDIRMDGNPRNDDCNMRDNTKTVTPAQANRLFTG